MSPNDRISPENNEDWILNEDIIPVHWHDKDFLFKEEPGCDEIKTLSRQQATAFAKENSVIKPLTEVEHENGGPKNVSRRHLLAGGLAATGLGALLAADPVRPRYSYAAQPNGNRIVLVFLRGAWDGLTAFPAFGDPNYYKLRPNIGVKPEHCYPLNKVIGMHKALSGLKPIWDANEMAIIHASGLPNATRSHFVAQDNVERAAPASMRSGFLGRYLALKSSNTGTARAITFGSTGLLTLATNTGSNNTLAMSSLDSMKFDAFGINSQHYLEMLKSMYVNSGDEIQGQANLAFQAVNELKKVRENPYLPGNGATYTSNGFGNGLKEIARMIKANVGMEVACIDYDGWDHHERQGVSGDMQSDLARKLIVLGDNLLNFRQDLGTAEWNKTTVIMISEFGRRAYDNGVGSDHGTGGVQLFLGGKIRGGIHGTWPTLSDERLDDGGLALSNDFRNPMADILANSFSVSPSEMKVIFPDFTPKTFDITK